MWTSENAPSRHFVNIAPQRPGLTSMLLGQMPHVSVCAWGVYTGGAGARVCVSRCAPEREHMGIRDTGPLKRAEMRVCQRSRPLLGSAESLTCEAMSIVKYRRRSG